MLLAIDCGNTNTVFSIWDGEEFIATWRTSTEWKRTADQYYVWLSALLLHHRIPMDINAVMISTTVPRVVFNLRVLADRYFSCRPLVVGKPECLLPTQPRVDEGTVVGPDRLGHSMWSRMTAPMSAGPSRRGSTCPCRRCMKWPPPCRTST